MQLVEEIPFPDLEKRLQNVSPEEREAAVAAFANLFGPQKIMSSVTYSYDAKWRVLERRMRMGDLSDDRTTSRYDDHDNPIEKTIVDTHREMHADEEGKLQTTKEDSNAQTVRFEYVYDPQGNWTEQVVSGRWEPNPNFQRSNVSRRDITYYPAT
jgi:YD repeat-containing protein